MSTYELRAIDAATLDEYCAGHPLGNYQQTSQMGALRQRQGAEVEYLGLFRDGELAAATVLETYRSRLSTFCAVHDGPLCDFHDAELTKAMVDALGAHAKTNGAAQLEITPEFAYRVRDSYGAELPQDEGGAPDDAALKALTDAGCEHEGFTTGYTAVPRWRYLKDLTGFATADELLASYAKKARRNVHVGEISCVRVERLPRERLGEFHAVCQMSAERQDYENRPLSYFEDIYDCFGDKARFLAAYMDMDAYVKSLEEKRDHHLRDVERLSESIKTTKRLEATQRKLDEAKSAHGFTLKRLEDAAGYIERDGHKPILAVGLFVRHPREMVYLFSGSDDRYTKFCAPALLQHHVMSACVEEGIDRYNFYGIDGVFDDPDDPGRGVLEFKQGFNGYVEELSGDFTLVLRPGVYHAKQLAHKILGH